MRFTEAVVGDYCIYAGALEAPDGHGYTAALVVTRSGPGDTRAREAFREDRLACGYTWPTPEQALQYAQKRGRALVRSQSARLAC